MAEEKRPRRKKKACNPAKLEPKTPAVAVPVGPIGSVREEETKSGCSGKEGVRSCGFIALIG
ncbi:MAG TPA: hypothetical protein VJ376_06240, partial [Pseudomonadota bacterium]|nr:hypothetical protein [Pseudomonadota bacterium]